MKKLLLLAGAAFATGVSFGQTIISENFESGLPGTWTQVTNATDGGWLAGTASSLSSSYFSISTSNATNIVATNDDGCNCDKSNDRLISPSFDLSTVSTAVLGVDIFFGEGSYNGVTEAGSIGISTDGGATWSNLVTLTGDANWHTEMVNLTSYVGNSNVKISFLYNDGGEWEYGYAIDNFSVYVPFANDARLDAVNLPRYAATNSNTVLSMAVSNVGSSPITSLTVDWNDGTAHSSTISVNIPAFGSANVNHPTAVNYAVATEANINVTITAVNGGSDDDPSNNTGSALHNTVSQIVTKRVVFEEGTGTWCGWCPRGAVTMDYMTTTYPTQFIGIAVHNGDPMTVTAYDAAANFSGFPGSNVDRILLDQSVSQTNWESMFNARKDLVVPAGITCTSSGAGSSVVLDVSSTFYTPFAAANYRLAVVMVENNVTGTTSQYNQTNYYAGGSNGVMGGFESLPNPVPAAQMVYNHVGRALVGGYNGQAGTVPTSITDGQVVNYTFNYTVPATSNRANMYAVVMLIDQTTGEIVNAEEVSVAEQGLAELDYLNMSVFPNPATETMNIAFEANGSDYHVSVMDLQGRTVMAGSYTNLSGKQLIAVPVSELATGSYMVKISTEEGTKTMNVIVE